MTDAPNIRRSQRSLVAMSAICRSDSNPREFMAIADLSPEGCRVASTRPFLRVGQHVAIVPETLSSLGGVVRWVVGNVAGIEFDRPLYGPVHDHLCRTFTLADASEPPLVPAPDAELPGYLSAKIIAGNAEFQRKSEDVPQATRFTSLETRPGLRARQTKPEVVRLFLNNSRLD